ncbi:MAG: asparagine synthase (glutamine-hydrolyzing) [Candidatus Omnitrophota bacterium]
MCGICGFYQYKQRADLNILKAMNGRLIHRGPDDEGYYMEGPVGLAARRLSIIDLETGHQPLPSQSQNNWITYNGEVYNFQELKSDLQSRGFVFKTKTDTEVLVNLYEAYGIDFVKQLRGMFAAGIYDQKHDRLVLIRDHTGVKPLYYYLDPETRNLVFGSEIKAILEYPEVPRDIDSNALDLFLTLEYIPAPYSLFKHIRKLPAGHWLTYEKGKLRIEKYWDIYPFSPDERNNREKETTVNALIEEFRSLLNESVKMRMIADVPLGAFLSGGLDSSSITAAMASHSNRQIKTFSIGFEEKSYSELAYSEIVSQRFHTEHHTKVLSPDITDLVLNLADFWDEPLGDFSNFPTYLVSKTAREHVTVALSGDGGDELFGGYEHYLAQKIARWIDCPAVRPFHSWITHASRFFAPPESKKGVVNRIKRFGEGLQHSYVNRHFRWMMMLSGIQKRKLYSPNFLSETYLKPLTERDPFDVYFQNSRRFDDINQDMYLDVHTYMVDDILVKVDRMSMAASLEARTPLLDVKMVEFAFSLPSRFKVNGKTGKWFFKKAMEGILPDEIIYRRKEGFSIPINAWLKTRLKDFMLEYLSEKRIRESGYFHYPYIKTMIDEHLMSKHDHSHRLWPLILFQLWRDRF